MSKKTIKELVFEDGEVHPPKVRGLVEAWIDAKEDFNYKEEQGTIPVDVERGLPGEARRNFESFVNQHIEEDYYDDLKEDGTRKEIRLAFDDYWCQNDELQERFKEIAYYTHDASILINVSSAEEQGGIYQLLDEYGKQAIANAAYEGNQTIDGNAGSDGGDDEDEHKDQSSFGASKFPELYDIGVVDDNANVVESKLRGLAKAFLDDVEEILGEDRYVDVKWVQRAFLYWGKEKWDDEWIAFAVLCTNNQEIYEAISWLHFNDEDARVEMEKKYRGNFDIEVGNPDTDDATKAFLDAEVPGWDEDEDDEELDSDKSKWEKFEEKSEELDAETKETREQDEGEEYDSKWDKFEEQSTEQNGGGAGTRESESVSEGDCDSGGDSESGGSDSAEPNSIQGWAESEGTVDKVNKRSRTRAGTNSQGKETTKQSRSKNGHKKQTTSGTTDVECEDGGRPHEIQWPTVERMDGLEKNKIYEGNTFEWAMKLPKDSIDTLVTSPPYYALRDYDIEDAFPISGDFTCDHDWQDEFCTKCGSFLGQLGHEPDPATFVEHIVDLMDRYKEVLKPSGSLWLNIGDTYAGKDIDGRVKAKNKSRMMIPERVYRRMVQTGWHLRDYVIWVKKIWLPDDDLKGNGKPFASSNRLADQWEPMVRFTPEPDHYSDVDSNRLLPPSFDGDLGSEGIEGKFREGEDTQRGKTYNELGTNPPDVWLINSDGYDGDHRAVFPEELPKRCINITTPDKVCSRCGRPYDKEVHINEDSKLSPGGDYATYDQRCHCDADDGPGVAFDPFLGSGTTAVAAANNGFNWAGVELSEKYAELARDRIPKGRQVGIDQW